MLIWKTLQVFWAHGMVLQLFFDIPRIFYHMSKFLRFGTRTAVLLETFGKVDLLKCHILRVALKILKGPGKEVCTVWPIQQIANVRRIQKLV
jgi:hypothetical protein